MKSQTGCERFVDANVDNSPEFLAHLSECPVCRDAHRTIRELKLLDSAFQGDTFSPRLKSRILDEFLKPHPVPSLSLKFKILSFVAGIFSLVIIAMVFIKPPNFELSGNPPRQEILIENCFAEIAGEADTFFPINRKFRLKTGSAKITSHHGLFIKVSGPSEFFVSSDTIKISQGKVTVTVPEKLGGFGAEVPHGRVICASGTFTCVVQKKVTLIEVHSGKIETLSDKLESSVIFSGQKGTLGEEPGFSGKGKETVVQPPDSKNNEQ